MWSGSLRQRGVKRVTDRVTGMLRNTGIFSACGYWLRPMYPPVAALALVSCSWLDPVEQQSKTAMSAAQTSVMIVDAWVAGAAPSSYASATLQAQAEMLVDANRQIESGDHPGSADRIASAITKLSTAIRSAAMGIKGGDRLQVSRAQLDVRAGAADLAAGDAAYRTPKP